MKRWIRYSLILGILTLIITACTSAAEQNNIANSFSSGRNFDSAIISYTSAQVSDPDNPILYLNAAQAYFEQGEVEIAFEVLEQAILRGDEDIQAKAYYNMGNFFYLSQRPEEAVQAYKQSLLLNPENANTRHNLELAMQYDYTPTPIDDEIKTNPEESQINPSITPTPLPLDENAPTETPTPQFFSFAERTPEGGLEGDHFGNQGPVTPQPGETPTLPFEEDGEILDKEKQHDSTFGEFSDDVATPTNSEEKKGW